MEKSILYSKGDTGIFTNVSNTRKLIISPRDQVQETRGSEQEVLFGLPEESST